MFYQPDLAASIGLQQEDVFGRCALLLDLVINNVPAIQREEGLPRLAKSPIGGFDPANRTVRYGDNADLPSTVFRDQNRQNMLRIRRHLRISDLSLFSHWLRVESVAHATNADKVSGMVGVGLDLLAQIRHSLGRQ
jgi:hypothetical protein